MIMYKKKTKIAKNAAEIHWHLGAGRHDNVTA